MTDAMEQRWIPFPDSTTGRARVESTDGTIICFPPQMEGGQSAYERMCAIAEGHNRAMLWWDMAPIVKYYAEIHEDDDLLTRIEREEADHAK